MNRIQKAFENLDQKKEKALVGFVTAGDPTAEMSFDIILAMCQAGLDILELGVPFSDPTSDGPVIQRSSQRSLQSRTSLASVLDMTRQIRNQTGIPIILFSYYNPIFKYGCGRFGWDAVNAGADGVLVVDLPPEESDEMTSQWQDSRLSLIRLVAPTTPPARLSMIAKSAEGFLYQVSKTGVTGSQGLNLEEVNRQTDILKSQTKVPICVGFGISTPAQVASLSSTADGVVVGTAFEQLIEDNIKNPALPGVLSKTVAKLKAATRQTGLADLTASTAVACGNLDNR